MREGLIRFERVPIDAHIPDQLTFFEQELARQQLVQQAAERPDITGAIRALSVHTRTCEKAGLSLPYLTKSAAAGPSE